MFVMDWMKAVIDKDISTLHRDLGARRVGWWQSVVTLRSEISHFHCL